MTYIHDSAGLQFRESLDKTLYRAVVDQPQYRAIQLLQPGLVSGPAPLALICVIVPGSPVHELTALLSQLAALHRSHSAR